MAWTTIIVGGDGQNYGTSHAEYQIDSAADIADLPASAPGSLAYTADGSLMYRVNNSGTWVKTTGTSAGGGDAFYDSLLDSIKEDLGLDNIDAGIPEIVKTALLDIFQHVAYIDNQGQSYYDALYSALYGRGTLVSITASYEPGYETITASDSINDLKNFLTVTAHYSNGSSVVVDDYTLSGTLSAGTPTITVLYDDKMTSFQPTIAALPSGYTHRKCIVANATQVILSGLYETDMVGRSFAVKEMRTDSVNRQGHLLSSANFYVPFLWTDAVDVWSVNAKRFGNDLSKPQTISWEENKDYIIEAFFDGNKIYSNGVLQYELIAGDTMSSSNQMILLAYSANGTEYPERYRFAGKLYYLRIYNGSTLEHNYIPCTNSSNVTGLYDTVAGQFLAPTLGTLAWE